jgi:phage terminase large subunit-like protein
MYCLTADGEPRAEVYAAASKLDQAQILFRDAVAMVDQSPALSSRIEKSGGSPVWNLSYPATSSFFRPIASDRAQAGPRPHCALLDEIHEHDNDIVVANMRAGTKGRSQALLFEITNSGWDRESICWQHHEYSRKSPRGDATGRRVVRLRLRTGPLREARSERPAGRRLPGLRRLARREGLAQGEPESRRHDQQGLPRRQVREAEGMPAQASLVKRLNFCIWTEGADLWLDAGLWQANGGELRPLLGRSCFGGLDLSTVRDLSALCPGLPRH